MGEGRASIEEASEEELAAILAYLADRSGGDRPPVLVGGWAVYAFNRYSKSRDIDLVLSSNHRSSLTYWLREERGYEPRRQHVDGWRGAVKEVPSLDRDIVVDIGTFDEDYPFEGREATLDFDLALVQNVVKPVAGSQVTMPSRSLLLLYKLKAAWDRRSRIQRRSTDREVGKLVKDRADILALTDRARVADAWDLSFLRDQLDDHSFLIGVLEEAWMDENARRRYRSIRADEARKQIKDLLGLLDLR